MDKVIEKIQKLLALARSSNPNEAANAAAAAQRLMEEHELELADVQAHCPEKHVMEPIVPSARMRADRGVSDWRAALVNGVASGSGCRVWWERVWMEDKRGRKVAGSAPRMMGRRSNVQTAQYLFTYLDTELRRLAQEAWAAQVPRPLASAAVRWRNSFLVGAALVVHDRLVEQRKQFVGGDFGGSSTALAVITKGQEEVDSLFERLTHQMARRSPSAKEVNPDAFSLGEAAGASVPLGGGPGLPAKQGELE